MAEVEISVRCRISGCDAQFEYDNDNTLEQFILDMQAEGMAWPKGKPCPDDAAILISDPSHCFLIEDTSLKATLAKLGVFDGSSIDITAQPPMV